MASDTSGTDLEEINPRRMRGTTDIGTWSDKKRKKLQHMTEFQSGIPARAALAIRHHYVPLYRKESLI